MNVLILFMISYLIGSIPFAFVIGKVFYKTDVREHGSNNLGAGNTSRVLGIKPGVAVMILDMLKVSAVVFLTKQVGCDETIMSCCGLLAAVGHCWPIFVKFKGGKAVATMYGFLLGLFVFAGYSPLIFFLPLLILVIIIKLTKIISLASIISALVATVYLFIATELKSVQFALVIFSLLIIVRHKGNIERMYKRQENKITWM